jgi:hypothetical protein
MLTTTRSLFARIGADVTHHRALRAEWDCCGDLLDAYEDAPENSPERVRLGNEIADLCESMAAHWEASKTAFLTSSVDPAEFRADAAEWRTGTVQVGP